MARRYSQFHHEAEGPYCSLHKSQILSSLWLGSSSALAKVTNFFLCVCVLVVWSIESEVLADGK